MRAIFMKHRPKNVKKKRISFLNAQNNPDKRSEVSTMYSKGKVTPEMLSIFSEIFKK